MKKRRDFESKIRHSSYKRKKLRVVGVGYVPTPDADLRLSRALDILLRSAARELEGGIKEPPQDSPLTEAMERKDESQSSGKKAGTPQGNT